ncbi:hypothetical protein [Arcobacter roscoffensis]|uniref:Uncharacterized protein n=1 Tax=Arcobacter roscoffensis TaxID=2961520 RepID=A0ABY5E4D8_9BACT|nr:hypothetical protein [Arcobacter roscoffensis]UTJ06040.1 hypothetical protein NJU99_12375 [Arcobacter roscoffensis]
MEYLLLLTVFILLEFFESKWQKADTLHGLILNNFYLFKQNIFLYFSMHVTFFYTMFLCFYLNNFGFWMSSILIIKFLDITFKLSMMKKLLNGSTLEEVMPLNIQMSNIFRYMNVIIYPTSFIFALNLI